MGVVNTFDLNGPLHKYRSDARQYTDGMRAGLALAVLIRPSKI
jgi:hypothetical protein